MPSCRQITSFLWFDHQAEEAATFYVSVFKNSRIGTRQPLRRAGPGPKGTVMTIDFELDGQKFIALNGGPHFTFTEAISFSIECHSQEEVDHYWNRLTEGGSERSAGG